MWRLNTIATLPNHSRIWWKSVEIGPRMKRGYRISDLATLLKRGIRLPKKIPNPPTSVAYVKKSMAIEKRPRRRTLNYVELIIKEDLEDYYEQQMSLPDENDELGNSNANNNNIPMPLNQVVHAPRRQGLVLDASPYNFANQNLVAATQYYLLSPAHISSDRNLEQNTNMFADPNWQQVQSSLLGTPRINYNNNFAELLLVDSLLMMEKIMQNSQQYQPHQSYGFHKEIKEPLGSMNPQHHS
ncbi:hypothetical protein PIB30_079863 [Stylosanthes scabra]|uniref:Uncharacterized protein n=1 Tax=Stylosanthes scabra TaxID=79078 RepID=A0ABU6VUS0_9FABA|nr:hypothetical protein [Stylosanthes scabra]